eukprot:CAMPEP_0176338600 /NCGR_PEP_ID=MMETSP0126-20121128/81_1 /TAXON_ID=141414 ORGANISM="Strombidinopsis acuminatum, Strain SPMC142" /NCGR_SAMPLE_ID=MMETSP0126 /ASSEMBLY_ACC=CAM_ASM_000229 /LENGTH=123 /DNA_ID=CAMNT_0017681661 /DNA_START=521 /DNA_END=892 /DNA_ORIENTATION=-
MLKSKTEVLAKSEELTTKVVTVNQKLDAHEQKMDAQFTETKYWLEKYTTSYRDNDKLVNSFRAETRGKIERMDDILDRKVTVEDMKKNFRALNDMLFIKFKQVEDLKTTCRDIVLYQKLFYPM